MKRMPLIALTSLILTTPVITIIMTFCMCLALSSYIPASSIDWRDDYINRYKGDIEALGQGSMLVKSTDASEPNTIYAVYMNDSLASTVFSVIQGDTAAIDSYNELASTLDTFAGMYYVFATTYNPDAHLTVCFIHPLDHDKMLYLNTDGVRTYDALEVFTQATVPPSEPPAAETPAPSSGTETYDLDLTAGHYVGGLGIPTGRYTLTWVANNGNVYSPRSVNEIFREDRTTVYNNFDFYSGTELTVSGTLVLHIHTDNADFSKIKQRVIKKEVETVLAPGNYIAGTDFPEGTYFITAYEGHGNVYSHEADVNTIISTEPEAGHSIYQYNYATFSVGDSLEVSSCTIKLVPAGD